MFYLEEYHIDIGRGQVGNIIIYVNDNYEDGYTYLDSGKIRLDKTPGVGYIWMNFDDDHNLDSRALHHGSAVKGNKDSQKHVVVIPIWRRGRLNTCDWRDKDAVKVSDYLDDSTMRMYNRKDFMAKHHVTF